MLRLGRELKTGVNGEGCGWGEGVPGGVEASEPKPERLKYGTKIVHSSP